MISQVKRRHKVWNPFELFLHSHKGQDLLLTLINSELMHNINSSYNDQLTFD